MPIPSKGVVADREWESKPGRAPVRPKPFEEMKDRKVVVRLLEGRFEKKDLKAYYQTEWFKSLKAFVIRYYQRCKVCGREVKPGKNENEFTVHHNNYQCLFDEHVLHDVTLTCNRCNGWIARRRR